MIQLKREALVFSFPEVHDDAEVRISFQRTLRIPDDGSDYPLPPGLGCFPLRHVDDFGGRVSGAWIEHGGVMLPMYQAEAMWVSFDSPHGYPMAVKIAAGKINAVTGKSWRKGLHRHPQDYVVLPEQPWLDGYCVEKGVIRQFAAARLGQGYSAEEQLTGKAAHGGLQIAVFPMKRAAYERMMRRERSGRWARRACLCELAAPDMGLALGGRMRQEIYDDPHGDADWDVTHTNRCFVHLCNSQAWEQITGSKPPTRPPTAKEYTEAGLPWFEYYDDTAPALAGSKILAGLKSTAEISKKKRDGFLSGDEPVTPERIIALRKGLKTGEVRGFPEE
jgi:hypothetical protein